MVRRAEEEHTFSASGIQEKMRFFIYDFQQGARALNPPPHKKRARSPAPTG